MSSPAPQKDDEISRLRKALEAFKVKELPGNTQGSSSLGQVGTYDKMQFQTCKLP